MTCDSSRLFCFVTFRSGPGTPTSPRKATFQADSVMRATRDHSTPGAVPLLYHLWDSTIFGHRDARARVVNHGDRYGRDPAGPLRTSGTDKTETSCRRINGERFAALREKFPNCGAVLNRNKCLALARPLLYAPQRCALRESSQRCTGKAHA